MWVVSKNCLRLLIHCTRFPFSLALASAGRSIAAKIAMMAITTSNSINVKPCRPLRRVVKFGFISRRNSVRGFHAHEYRKNPSSAMKKCVLIEECGRICQEESRQDVLPSGAGDRLRINPVRPSEHSHLSLPSASNSLRFDADIQVCFLCHRLRLTTRVHHCGSLGVKVNG